MLTDGFLIKPYRFWPRRSLWLRFDIRAFFYGVQGPQLNRQELQLLGLDGVLDLRYRLLREPPEDRRRQSPQFPFLSRILNWSDEVVEVQLNAHVASMQAQRRSSEVRQRESDVFQRDAVDREELMRTSCWVPVVCASVPYLYRNARYDVPITYSRARAPVVR